MQPQAAGDDVAGDIGQPQIIGISRGAQPHECVPDAGAELLGEHPGGLVDLGPVQCQVCGLATGAGQCQEVAPRLVLGVEQQDGGGIGEDQHITELECGQRAWPLPVQAQHPGADRPDPQPEREDRRRPRLTCRLREDRPATPRFPGGQIRGQHRAARGSGIQARALPQGQMKFGELLADLIITRIR